METAVLNLTAWSQIALVVPWSKHGYSYVQKIVLQKNCCTKNAIYCRKNIEEGKKKLADLSCSWTNRVNAMKRNIPAKMIYNLIKSPPKFQ